MLVRQPAVHPHGRCTGDSKSPCTSCNELQQPATSRFEQQPAVTRYVHPRRLLVRQRGEKCLICRLIAMGRIARDFQTKSAWHSFLQRTAARCSVWRQACTPTVTQSLLFNATTTISRYTLPLRVALPISDRALAERDR